MFDASIDPHTGLPARSSVIPSKLVSTGNGRELDLMPDDDWLSDPATQYPVLVDPTTNLTDTLDAFVDNTYPTSPQYTNELRVGNYGSGSSGSNVAAFSSGVTWNSQPTRYSISATTNTARGDTCGGAGWVALNATAIAQNWAGLAHTTDYLGLFAPNEADVYQWHRFGNRNDAGQQPYLSVNYASTPTVPTSLATQFTDSWEPKMSGLVHDADGSAQTVTFVVKDSGGSVIAGAGGTVSNVANGARAGFQVPSDKLRVTSSYTWTMRSCNGSLCSPWTSAQNLVLNPSLDAGALRGHTTDKHALSDLISESTDVTTGNVMLAVTGLTLRGSENASLPLGAVYNSLSGASNAVPAPGSGSLGNGAWQFTAGGGVRLITQSDSSVIVLDPSGATRPFCCEPGPYYFRPADYDADLNKQPDGTYKLVEHVSQTEYDFTSAGVLTRRADRNHNAFTFSYDSNGHLTGIDA
jgi:hypothetical protein